MDFKRYLQTAARQIDQLQEQYLTEEIKKAQKFSPKTVHLVETFAQACKGGKRLRGALVKLGYEIAGGEENQEIFRPALAFEIFQTAILAHDDIIDKSPTRRGKPTLFYMLGGSDYGISQTICLGDIGFFLSFQLIAESHFPESLVIKALQSFIDTALKTGAGEMLDVEISQKSEGEYNEEDSLTISNYKTAHYTIIGPMQLGAILAGAPEQLLENIEQFGQNLGIAFQIQDDILGVFGDEQSLGKSVTSDIEEGKNTLLITYALEHASAEQKKFLETYYGKGQISEDNFAKIKQIFVESGALDYSRTKALKYVDLAKKAIPKIAVKAEHKQLLNELADFLIERNK